MNAILVLFCCFGSLVPVRPDVSLGYHYNPDYNSGSSLLSVPAPSTSYIPAASGPAAGGFGSSSGNFISSGYNIGGVAAGGSGGFGSDAFSSGGYNSGIGSGFNQGGLAVGINQGYSGSLSSQQQYAQQAPIITKHFYLHTAPEDNDNQDIVRYITIGRPMKNYRVVFINAPSSTSSKAKIIANVAPVEEKTAIYVLTKKANELDVSAEVVTPAPIAPSKPDVFFIKYKTPQEATHAQHVIQAQYDKLGGSSDFSNGGTIPVQSVIGSLGQTSVDTNSNVPDSTQFNSQGGGVSAISFGQGQTQQVGIGNVNTQQPQPSYLPPNRYRRSRYYKL